MCIRKTDSLCDLVVFHCSVLKEFFGFVHACTDQDFGKSLSCHFFKYGAEIAGADVQIGADVIET